MNKRLDFLHVRSTSSPCPKGAANFRAEFSRLYYKPCIASDLLSDFALFCFVFSRRQKCGSGSASRLMRRIFEVIGVAGKAAASGLHHIAQNVGGLYAD